MIQPKDEKIYLHIYAGGCLVAQLDTDKVSTIEELAAKVKTYRERYSDMTWAFTTKEI